MLKTSSGVNGVSGGEAICDIVIKYSKVCYNMKAYETSIYAFGRPCVSINR